MDIFAEQIVKIRLKTVKVLVLFALIAAAILVSAVLFLYSLKPGYSLLILGIVAVIYGTYKLLNMFFVEYEYIVTNGTLDIDKIVAKSSRKRIVSFDVKTILRGDKYNKNAKPVTDAADTLVFCDEDAPDAYYLLIQNGAKKRLIVFAPNEKIQNAIKECLPRAQASELFK